MVIGIMDSELIERALERRLRERALRAENEVDITPETIERWIREELESIVQQVALFRAMESSSHIWN